MQLLKKSYHIFLLFIIFNCSLLSSMPIRLINRDNIEQHRQQIETELKRNTILRAAIGGTIGVGCCAIMARLLMYMLSSPVKNTEIIVPGTWSPEAIQALQGMAQHYNAKNSSVKVGFIPTIVKDAAISIGQQVIVLGIFTGLNNSLGPLSKYIQFFDGIVTRTIEKIYHKSDLQWFIAYHTNYTSMFEQLQQHSQFLQGIEQDLSEQLILVRDNQYYKNSIQNTWNALINDVEAILGFMEYKQELNEDDYVYSTIQTIIDEIERITNNCAQQIHENMQKSDNFSMIQISNEYKQSFDDALQSFMRFEFLII